MMFLRFYLFVGAYSNTHEVHETFDLDHGTSTEPLENHENVLHNAALPEQQDVYNYELDTHNLHEQLHDGSDFVIEDHVEHPATWNFMEDANKTAEEAGESPPGSRAGRSSRGSSGAAISGGASSQQTQRRFSGGPSFSSSRFRQPTARTGSSGLACTNDATKATLMANQLIGMLFRSSQMMSDIVNMFTIPNPAASRPSQYQGGNPGFNNPSFSNPTFGNPNFGNPNFGNPGFGSGGYGGFTSPNPVAQTGAFNTRFQSTGSATPSSRAAQGQISAAAMSGAMPPGMRMSTMSHGSR